MYIENIETKVKNDNGILDFIKTQINIEIINDESYGHYPFQLKYISKNNLVTIAALALNGIEYVMEKIEDYTKMNYQEILFSLDYPKSNGMENDFIVVFSIKEGNLELIALEYDIDSGDVTRIVQEQESKFLSVIAEQIKTRLALAK